MFDLSPHLQRVALVEGEEEITYRQLSEDVALLEKRLSGARRSLVAVLCRNRYEVVVLYLAALGAGVVPLLLDAGTAPEFVDALLERYRPRFLFRPADACGAAPLGSAGGGAAASSGSFRGYELVPLANAFEECHPSLGLLLTTSGSTGSPKLVRLSRDNLRANAESIVAYLEIDSSDRAITTLPLHYSFGLSILNTHLLRGARLVLTSEPVTSRAFWDTFRSNEVTSLSGVPYTYRLLDRLRFTSGSYPSLRMMTQAGGKLEPVLVEKFSVDCRHSGVRFCVMYGQTEATARISYAFHDSPATSTKTIGRAIPGGRLSIESESGEKLDPVAIGELVYEGPNVMLGYAESSADLTAGDLLNGRLATGDLGYYDGDLNFYITGRKKRFIKLMGVRTHLDELQEVLAAEGVDNICTGTDGHLVVGYLAEENLAASILRTLSQKCGIHHSIVTVRQLPQFPVSESGKILYKQLLD